MKLLAWMPASFRVESRRSHDGYTYFENAITSRRSCIIVAD